jgi:hypothetical protein
MPRPGDVAEWLGRGLQSLVQRFESARRLLAYDHAGWSRSDRDRRGTPASLWSSRSLSVGAIRCSADVAEAQLTQDPDDWGRSERHGGAMQARIVPHLARIEA